MRESSGLALLAVALYAIPARGSLDPGIGEPSPLQLGGYMRTLVGLQKLRDPLVPDADGMGRADHLGLADLVLRLEWKCAIGNLLSAEMHQRVFQRISSESLILGGSRIGLGASVVPQRSVDLRFVAYREERLLLEHDLDRLVLRANLGHFDVFLGRQAITWGAGELFPVADLWTTASPFELDTSQKHGVDALRVLFSRSREWEWEAVLADRGTLRDLSAGLRVANYRTYLDSYVAIAKQWREMLAMAGVATTLGNFKLRGEAASPYDLDRHDFSLPQITVATDWLHSHLNLTLEAHYNGTGVQQADQYSSHLGHSPVIAHGKSYLLGRLYAGAAAKWTISELLQLTVSGIGNLQDPSVLLATAFAWRLEQETELTFGTFQGLGKGLGSPSTMRSEYGSLGSFYYLALASYF
jgi:hypothetical protein